MAVDKLTDSAARDYELGAMAQAIRLCLLDTAQFSQAEVELMGIPWLDRLGFAQAVMQGIKPYISGGGIKVVSGTKTLTETARRFTVETGETSTGKLFLVIVTQTAPTYNINGTIGAIRAKWPVSFTQGGNVLNNIVSATVEARTSYENYAGLTLIGNSDLTATYDDDEIEFVARTNAYPFFVGTYKWYAFYGEVYNA